MSEEPQKVLIHNVRTIVSYPKGVEQKVHVVIYTYGDRPARPVYIPEDEDTPEERKKRIRDDIEAAEKEKPEVLEI